MKYEKTQEDIAHEVAMINPAGLEKPIKDIWLSIIRVPDNRTEIVAEALKIYRHRYFEIYEVDIQHDYYLGKEGWSVILNNIYPFNELEVMKGLHTLLNGDTGRLHCGRISDSLMKIAKERGYKWG